MLNLKLNFIIGSMDRKKQHIFTVWYDVQFQYVGGLETYPPIDKGVLLYIITLSNHRGN